MNTMKKRPTVELMDGAELVRWQAQRTLPQLGHMMAAWYTRNVVSRPGLRPKVGPDPLIAATPGMRLALTSINRIGLVTIKAQPGAQNLPASAPVWATLCAVQGFVNRPVLEDLIPQLEAAFIHYRVWPVRPMWKLFGGAGVPVVYQNGQPTPLRYGRQMSVKDIRAEFDVCHPDMITALAQSQQITMWHPITGCNDLWPLLTEWSFPHS